MAYYALSSIADERVSYVRQPVEDLICAPLSTVQVAGCVRYASVHGDTPHTTGQTSNGAGILGRSIHPKKRRGARFVEFHDSCSPAVSPATQCVTGNTKSILRKSSARHVAGKKSSRNTAGL